MKKSLIHGIGLLALTVFALAGCKGNKERSTSTGWKYNDQTWGGFEKLNYKGQATGPNLALIEGGTYTMGLTDQDVTYEWNNTPRRVTVASFYMDETEVRNVDYREYLFWLKNTFGDTYPEVPKRAMVDTMVWRDELSFNEPMVETYFRHPAFDDYPVVGVNWFQANEFAIWRTDRVNEMILVEKGILELSPEQKNENNFHSESYLVGQYDGTPRKNLKDIRTGEERKVRFEDGILLPAYRLPTEAEWEYAALSLVGNQATSKDELVTDRRIYPWDGNSLRYQKRNKYQGKMLANFKRSQGDYGGMAGALNDKAFSPAPVRTNMPNDFGLYNMAGNVSEWTLDLYRPMTASDLQDYDQHDLNPYRGNIFKTKVLDPETGSPVQKDSIGRLSYRMMDTTETALRDNFKRPELFNYLDGDKESEVEYRNPGAFPERPSSLISDKTRVIKGGSWADRAFWLSPGARRFMDEDKSSRSVGFRCAMTRTGSPTGNDGSDGNTFKVKQKKTKRRYK